MKVFKFGGASVKDADAVRNVAKVISLFPDDEIVVVVSAMGKTTNAMEKVWEAYCKGTADPIELVKERRDFHTAIMQDLFNGNNELSIWNEVDEVFSRLENRFNKPASQNPDYEYDQIVSVGEIVSTKIINAYLQEEGLTSKWFDARKLVRTDNSYREGRVDWEKSAELINNLMKPFFNNGPRLAITQGFLGHTAEGMTTTLGREGSDFTAAILAYLLDAEDATIWKDVPGVLNADPKWFSNTVKLEKISFREAIELSYYGATVIHPKTIKPLQNKEIPLYVKSFVNPEESGTMIQKSLESDFLIPSFIFKMEQVLISISPRDFSFIIEDSLRDIFAEFANSGVRINLMQNSAINFSACADNSEKLPTLIEKLRERFEVKYNDGLELVTIRHYDDVTINRVTENKEILVKQMSRHTARMVMRDLN
jgi:aspartate kinase